MKKILLSIFAVLFAFAGAQAEELKTVQLLPSDVAGQGTSGNGSAMEYTVGSITFAFDKGYGHASNIRAYKDCVITISGATIKSVQFTASGSSYNPDMTVNTGSVTKSGTTSTWTGEAALVEFTVAAQLRATKIEVTYVESSVEAPVVTFDGNADAFEDEITVNVSSTSPAYYTLNGETPTIDSDICPSELVIRADATLKVVAIENGEASALVTQEFKKAVVLDGAYATLVEDVANISAGDEIVIVANDYNYALSTNQKSNNRGQVAIQKSGKDIVAQVDELQVITVEEGASAGTYAFNVGDGYLYAASSSSNYLRTQTSLSANSSWKITIEEGVASIIAQGSNANNVMQYNQSSSLFACYASASQKPLSIYKVNEASIEAYTLTVGDAGWATLFLNYDAEIPAGATCYAVTAVDGESAKLAEVEGAIPSNTAVIVNAEAGEYKFEVAAEAEGVAENELQGTLVNEYKKEEAYVLAVVDGKVGLYKAAMAGGVWLNNANKAYLPASAVPNMSAAFYGFDWNGTTGVEKVEIRNENGEIFDLTGRKVNSITAPGIYIVGGKKVLVK